MKATGYKKQRFPNLQGEMFDCTICNNVVQGPKQCSGCGNLYCTVCIDAYQKQNKSCPNRCIGNSITNMSARALINIYNDLDIKCTLCSKTFKLGEIQKHEDFCGRTKCAFAQFCQGYEDKKAQYAPFCSQKCNLFNKVINCQGDPRKLHESLLKIPAKINNGVSGVIGNQGLQPISSIPNSSNKIQLKWSTKQCGMNIIVASDHSSVFLKQQAYVFRTVVSNQPFLSGRHYWQIHADSRTQNQLKIGVTALNNFDFNTAFCDHKFGFAYYGLGQLRHGSNATGSQYGKRFKKTGVLGVFLNMDAGTLSFSLNGEDFGQAYRDADLKKGPLYPSVALLHCSGCTIKGQLPIPVIYASK